MGLELGVLWRSGERPGGRRCRSGNRWVRGGLGEVEKPLRGRLWRRGTERKETGECVPPSPWHPRRHLLAHRRPKSQPGTDPGYQK